MKDAPGSRTRRVKRGRIPSLDGLRAVAIGLVLIAHLDGTRGFPLTSHPVLRALDWGHLGVRVFFVLSGFLITKILIDEIHTTGGINLKRFYFRRTLRIFPAYYTYVAAVTLAGATGLMTLSAPDLLHAISYTTNYHYSRRWALGHSWSLAVEEQFYLIWPVLLVLAGLVKGLRWAAIFVVAAPLLRFLVLAQPGPPVGMGFTFETAGDALAVGCLLAGIQSRLWSRRWYRTLLQSRYFVLVPSIALATGTLATVDGTTSMAYVAKGAYVLVGISIMNVAIALTIDWAMRHPDSYVGRILNAGPLIYIGALSYSLYLWQQPFLNRSASHPWTSFPLNIVVTFAAAAASYYLVESPILRLRARIEGRRALAAAELTPPSSNPGPRLTLVGGNGGLFGRDG